MALVALVGSACALGGYFAGRHQGAIEDRIAPFASSPKPDKPAAETAKPPAEIKRAETHVVKQSDKTELARLAKAVVEPKTPSPPTRPEEIEPPLLGVSLLEKDILEEGAADGKGAVMMTVAFENLAGKPIRAFEGVLKFTDKADNRLYSSPIAVATTIAEGATLTWDERLDARKLDDAGKRLLAEGAENLKAVFQVKKVFFSDGSVKKYSQIEKKPQG